MFGDLLYEGILLCFENVYVNSNAGSFHARQNGHQGQLQVGIKFERINLLELCSEPFCQLHNGCGLIHQGGIIQQGKLLRGSAEGLLEVALVDVGKRVSALTGAQQVGGNGRVVGNAG